MGTNINPTTPCMACDGEVKFTQKPKVGFNVMCKRCETEYIVISVDPIELEWVFDDFDEDDRDFDDYRNNDDDYADYDDYDDDY